MAAILDGQFFDFSMGPSDKTYQSSSSPAVIVQINDVLLTPSELLSPSALEYLAEEIEINTIDELASVIYDKLSRLHPHSSSLLLCPPRGSSAAINIMKPHPFMAMMLITYKF